MPNQPTRPASFLAVFSDNTHLVQTFTAVSDWRLFCRLASDLIIEHTNRPGRRELTGFHYAYGTDHSSYLPSEVDDVIHAVHS